MAKADGEQGFKDPERQPRGTEPPAGPSPFSDANTAHKVLLSKKEQRELGIEKSIPCTSRLFGGPSCALPPQPDDLPLHLCDLPRDPCIAGKQPCFRCPCFPLLFPPLHTLLL